MGIYANKIPKIGNLFASKIPIFGIFIYISANPQPKFRRRMCPFIKGVIMGRVGRVVRVHGASGASDGTSGASDGASGASTWYEWCE
jgi:hypothetical protein